MSERETYAYLLIRCVPGSVIGIRFVCLREGRYRRALSLHRPQCFCIYRPVYLPIDPRSPGCDSLKTFRRKYRKRSRVAASNDVVAISDDIVFDVERESERERERG